MPKITINEKGYLERRNVILDELQGLVDACNTETRAFNEEEQNQYSQLMTELNGIDSMLKVADETRALEPMSTVQQAEGANRAELETRAFDAYIRGSILEERAEVNMTKTDNGAVIPNSISNRILEKVKEKAPIYAMATKFNTGGDLTFPVYDEDSQRVSAAYAEEFRALTSTAGRFRTITMKGYLSGVLSKVSISLVNNIQFDLVSFVVDKVAESMADFLRGELIRGTEGKMSGLLSTTNLVSAAAQTAVTADEIIDLEFMLPESLKGGAVWLMNRNTLKAIQKLKDTTGRYLMTEDLTVPSGYVLRGKGVYIDEKMPDMAAGEIPILFGDLSGLYVKMTETPSVQVLREKYADEHAIGVIAWMEADSKIVEPQKIAGLKMAAGG